MARGERALLVVPDIGARRGLRTLEARIAEAAGLAEAIGVELVERRGVKVRAPRAASLFGKGQIAELAELAARTSATLLIVDAGLNPVQQKTLEEAVAVKVIDRTGVILEIFGERARSAEGRLQVELAHLDYQAGRLVRSWTHLERQRGGFGFLGGPGETQIEADRRLIRDRMARIRQELEQVRRTRGLHRDRRKRAPWPVIALVGYTNAGKSTLFNRLTGADVVAEDLLFATLDPTMREIRLPGLDKAILSDTVGFVSDLPPQLVAAFRATLEEVAGADLIVHVRDVAHSDSEAQAEDVAEVLVSLGLDGDDSPPRMEVWNKLDAIPVDERESLLAAAARRDDVACISALDGSGLDQLRHLLARQLGEGDQLHRIILEWSDGARLAWLHAHGQIVERSSGGEGHETLAVRLSPREWARFQSL